MNWTTRDRTHTCPPYTIVSSVRGYEIWLKYEGHFGVLKREVKTLEGAKNYCREHAVKELDAVSVK